MSKAESCIIGLGCTSLSHASTSYMQWLKKKKLPLGKAIYVSNVAAFVPETKQRLVMVDGVKTLFDLLPRLSLQDRVLVSDSPVLLMEIPHITILDLERKEDQPYSFTVLRFNPQALHKTLDRSYKRPIPISSLGWTRLDQLGLLVDNNLTGHIATPYKNVLAQLDHTERQSMRRDIAAWASGTMTVAQVDENLRSRLKASPLSDRVRDTLVASLTKVEPVVRKALPLLRQNRSIVSAIKGTPVTGFELKFLQKIVMSDGAGDDQ